MIFAQRAHSELKASKFNNVGHQVFLMITIQKIIHYTWIAVKLSLK